MAEHGRLRKAKVADTIDQALDAPACTACAHFRRPGMSAGYCIGRDDLAPVYGHLRALPTAGADGCEAFARARAGC